MRRAFLMLFPGLFAQAPRIPTTAPSGWTGKIIDLTGSDPERSIRVGTLPPPKRKPLNGECPVCGEMAPPYRWEPPRFCSSSVWVDSEGMMRSTCDPPAKAANLTRCAHCSNAFYQDAEVSK